MQVLGRRGPEDTKTTLQGDTQTYTDQSQQETTQSRPRLSAAVGRAQKHLRAWGSGRRQGSRGCARRQLPDPAPAARPPLQDPPRAAVQRTPRSRVVVQSRGLASPGVGREELCARELGPAPEPPRGQVGRGHWEWSQGPLGMVVCTLAPDPLPAWLGWEGAHPALLGPQRGLSQPIS